MRHKEILERVYNNALLATSKSDYSSILSQEIKEKIETLVAHSQTNKAIITVLVTLLTQKLLDTNQDIRYHQAQLPNGFSGRSIDKEVITPFMKEKSFPSMSESGWLTRSLEQAHPYTLDYPGNIRPTLVKNSFLQIIDNVQVQGNSAEEILLYLFKLLIKQRDDINIDLAKPHSLSISSIIKLLEHHFTFDYSCAGASRLPTLAIYASYQCMMEEVARYNGKILCPLESHNSADSRSGRIGDIDINNEDGSAFEGIEIKHEIQITRQLIKDAYEKFKIYNTDRYYLLTTANMDTAKWNEIEEEIRRIRQIHGCQVIVNGVYTTLKYYLRLLQDPAKFIDRYVELLKVDETVKYQHKVEWNNIISQCL